MTTIPRIHQAAITFVCLFLHEGVKHLICPKINLAKFNELVEDHKVNAVFNTNTPLLLEVINQGKLDSLKSLKYICTGGMPIPVHTLKKGTKELQIAITSMYGSTETGLISLTTAKNSPFNSAGNLVPNFNVKVVDVNDSKQLGYGKNGEICVKTPSIMKQYFNAESNDNLAKDAAGWFRTGDFGHIDENGFIYIVDRIKEMIKVSRGYALFPAEIEAVILRHPKVKEAAVIGVKHPTLMEVPKAFVVRKDNSLSEDEIIKFYNEEVADHMRLEGGVSFIEKLPRIGIGKIQRRKLKDLP